MCHMTKHACFRKLLFSSVFKLLWRVFSKSFCLVFLNKKTPSQSEHKAKTKRKGYIFKQKLTSVNSTSEWMD